MALAPTGAASGLRMAGVDRVPWRRKGSAGRAAKRAMGVGASRTGARVLLAAAASPLDAPASPLAAESVYRCGAGPNLVARQMVRVRRC